MWSNTNTKVIKADHYQITALTNLIFGFLLILKFKNDESGSIDFQSSHFCFYIFSNLSFSQRPG